VELPPQTMSLMASFAAASPAYACPATLRSVTVEAKLVQPVEISVPVTRATVVMMISAKIRIAPSSDRRTRGVRFIPASAGLSG